MKFRIVPVTALGLALAACGSADDASTEAQADTVEVAADEAMDPVTQAPVADPAASVTQAEEREAEATVTAQEAQSVEDAGDNAAATAEAAMDAMMEE